MRIGIVGGGVSGLTAAYLLSQRHEVRLFDAGDPLGGHTATVLVDDDGRKLPIDMGFIVFNDWTYPNFIRLLGELGVDSVASDMSFSVRCERTGLEYNGSSLNQLFAQRRNFVRLSFLKMLVDILRFNRRARASLLAGSDLTLGQFLDLEGFRGPMVEHYLVPMVAAIWSGRPDRMLDFPMRSLTSFLDNHGLLSVNERPHWRSIRGGSQSYVQVIARRLGPALSIDSPVRSVRRIGDGVEIELRRGETHTFDRAVMACHSDQALSVLSDATPGEREVLGAIPYQPSEVVLHEDTSLLPRRRLAWASWNYHHNTPQPGGAQVTYYMNRLQRLETERHFCVTLNRTCEIDPQKILARRTFSHPVFTSESVAAQERWEEISGARKTHFCGAYWGFGFHEDGVNSAVRVASQLGVDW